MIDLAAILIDLYPNRQFGIGDDYQSLIVYDDGPVPTLQELEQAWPRVQARLANEQSKAARQMDFVAEADVLFLKWQAGEATEEEWLAKRQEIRDRHPYVDELE